MTGPKNLGRSVSRTSSNLKLLFYVTEDWYFASHRLQLAIAAKQAGYKVIVATRVRSHGDCIRNAGLTVVPFENSRARLNPFTELWTIVRLVRLYRRERPSLVHHVALKPVFYGTLAAKLAGNPRVINAFAGLGWLYTSRRPVALVIRQVLGWLMPWLLRSGTTLVQNPDDARLLMHIGVPRASIRLVLGSGVDLAKFAVSPEAASVPKVVLPARLIWEKGVNEFVKAARVLKRRGIAAEFVLAGQPDCDNRSAVPTATIEEWVRDGVVKHVGWVSDMATFLTACHVVCLPSFYGEGVPKSLIEAAAAGRPIVTTDTPGCREIVRHEENGLLVPPKNHEALAAAIERLLLDPLMRQRMGMRGRALAEEQFGIERVIRDTLSIYEESDQNLASRWEQSHTADSDHNK